MKRVYLFAEGNKSMINLLGGKGGNLAEMKKIGLPIPEGIIISTEACKEYYGNGELLSEELKNEVLEQINKQLFFSTLWEKLTCFFPIHDLSSIY